jgi:uncharacterized protein (DUF2141 family)
MSRLRTIIYVLGILIWFVVSSCANKGYPEGGPKDTTPPNIMGEQPPSFSTDFKSKDIRIYFDEYVDLKNINDNFIISPPQTKKPKVRLRPKYVLVEFQDSLRENTTYSLDFGDAIVDLNEANPLGYYRYVFSTGKQIDSLELSGTVVDAETNNPMLGAYVFVYEQHADSVPLKNIPNYMASTDSSGNFRLTNLSDKVYKMVALKDADRNYKYTPEVEEFAFLDSLLQPITIQLTRTDTVSEDSIVTSSYIGYGPSNIRLRMFQERLTQLYMLSEERKERERLTFIFSIPEENRFEIQLLDTVSDLNEVDRANWYMREQSFQGDTINIWLRDSVVYKRDTLNFVLNYLRTDSTRKQVPYTDTVKLVYKDKQTAKRNRRNEKDVPEPYKFLQIITSKTNTQDINRDIPIEFGKPVADTFLKYVVLKEKVDTVYLTTDFEWVVDANNVKRFSIRKQWKAGAEYMLTIDSATVYDIYGFHNDKFERIFKVKEEEDYGTLNVNLSGVKSNVIVQLFKSQSTSGATTESSKPATLKKPIVVAAEQKVSTDGEVQFKYVQPGRFGLRVIVDVNGNGKWDTGIYLQGIQPEPIFYMKGDFEVRKNFDIIQEFDLNE